jgi:predicted TIM-barrel fold metal-dependent hydrolase
LPRRGYDILLASSLLHHLQEPLALWRTVARHATRGSLVFVADLRRPRTRTQAEQLTRVHAAGEPAVLRRDFHNSLLAAFTPEEVRAQLARAKLRGLTVEPLGDRHLLVFGRLP